MKRIKMIVQYDGKNYHGFQIQKNANTIQAEIENGIANLTGEQVSLLFASRTDAGVHAQGQVIAFDTMSGIPAGKWCFALNSVLPRDIHIIESSLAQPGFHPRFDARKKTYCYLVYREAAGSIFFRNYALCSSEALDLEAMKKACGFIEGCQNFKSFCASGSAVKNHHRHVYLCQIKEQGPLLKLFIQADGFLYHMVRIIMGTLLEVGRGNLKPAQIIDIILSEDRNNAGPTAAPQGLFLISVEY